MSAQPVDQPGPDPEEILASLPAHWRAQFRAEYEDAVRAALRPERYQKLQELLHRWQLKAIAVSDPAFDLRAEQAREAAGTPIETVVPDWEERVAQARARR